MKKLLLLGVVGLIGGTLWLARQHDAPDSKLVFDRIWVDHQPRHPKDSFQVLFILGDRPVGQFAVQTPWKGRWEGFHYDVVPRHDGDLDLIFPDSGERQHVHLRARRCNENGFDFCLEVSGSSRGARRYFSRREWARPRGASSFPDQFFMENVDDESGE